MSEVGKQENANMEMGWIAVWKQWKDKFGKKGAGYIDGEGKDSLVTKIPSFLYLVSSLTAVAHFVFVLAIHKP